MNSSGTTPGTVQVLLILLLTAAICRSAAAETTARRSGAGPAATVSSFMASAVNAANPEARRAAPPLSGTLVLFGLIGLAVAAAAVSVRMVRTSTDKPVPRETDVQPNPPTALSHRA